MSDRRRNGKERIPIEQRLLLLRRGLLSDTETADFAADAGTENFVRALPDVERLLDHWDPIVRYNALATLAYEWGTSSRQSTIGEMLMHDPDADCRSQAASALGSLLRGTRDRNTIELLVRVASDPKELASIRASSYIAALDTIGVAEDERPARANLVVGEAELSALAEHLESI